MTIKVLDCLAGADGWHCGTAAAFSCGEEDVLMANAARNHRDNVFCMLYRDRKNLLSLYNVMNGTNYGDEEELDVVTLDFAICVSMRNDSAFVIDSRLNLYEQQSTVNPNMPLRNLYYISEELKKLGAVRSG